MAKWHMTREGLGNFGPYEESQMQEFAASGRLTPQDMVWQEGTPQWVVARSVPGWFLSPPPPPPPPIPGSSPFMSRSAMPGVENKIAAGLCGILLGPFGVHKFILGRTTQGVIMLLSTILTFGLGAIIMGPIGLIEGIIYLTKSDEEFYQTYVVEKKGWF